MNPREFFTTRILNAPRELVFDAWTNADQVVQWWGPRDYPATHMEMDVRPDGKWRSCLTSPTDGNELWLGGVFQEVSPPERLVFSFTWEEEGERGNPTLVTVTFTDLGQQTKMEFHQTPFLSDEQLEGHSYGWNSTFDRFEEWIAKDR